jgi:DNA polymerase II small subunit
MEIQELITHFTKKGYLLDKESMEFFYRLENIELSEEILNNVFFITRSRMVSKKILNEHYREIRELFKNLQEKAEIINDFFENARFKEEVEEKNKGVKKTEAKKEQASRGLKILSSEIIPYRKIEVRDFLVHFKNRYNFFKSLFIDRKELSNLVSINKIGNNRSFSIIALVRGKRMTKNKNFILEVEDLTGKIEVLVSHDKEELMKKAAEIMGDDVIGIRCSGSGEFVYANDILFADAFLGEKRKSEEEAYALFISDIHTGSKLFLAEKFEKFIKWINCDGVEDENLKEKIRKIKYLFIAGDNIDGVGVYPGQEALLEIKSCKEQYKKLGEFLKRIPDSISIIMCAGQHDAVRVPEPQPALDEEFAKEICAMKNVYLTSNPCIVEIESFGNKKGIVVMIYHGASIIDWINNIDELRQGQAHLNPSKVGKYMLRHRHLSPTHSMNVYVPSEKEDFLAIKEVPDILALGDLHKTDIDIYNNILIICSSCWQSTTPFEEKVGNRPDPAKVPMLNLKTREIKILDFS